jgi:hypothetical protein
MAVVRKLDRQTRKGQIFKNTTDFSFVCPFADRKKKKAYCAEEEREKDSRPLR